MCDLVKNWSSYGVTYMEKWQKIFSFGIMLVNYIWYGNEKYMKVVYDYVNAYGKIRLYKKKIVMEKILQPIFFYDISCGLHYYGYLGKFI